MFRFYTHMDIRESVRIILSEKKARQHGLHVKHITSHILNMNRNLFSDDVNPCYQKLKIKINSLLLYDVKKKKGRQFSRVINPKTEKYRKGWYKLVK